MASQGSSIVTYSNRWLSNQAEHVFCLHDTSKLPRELCFPCGHKVSPSIDPTSCSPLPNLLVWVTNHGC
ncbi:hypothetical protein SESBI_39374 [Sesbania bispinosa]|nr:hypothetical protein SESBI_39374 [Sesbania bispinosa]